MLQTCKKVFPIVSTCSKMSQNVPICPKMSQNVHFRRIIVQMDLFRGKRQDRLGRRDSRIKESEIYIRRSVLCVFYFQIKRKSGHGNPVARSKQRSGLLVNHPAILMRSVDSLMGLEKNIGIEKLGFTLLKRSFGGLFFRPFKVWHSNE